MIKEAVIIGVAALLGAAALERSLRKDLVNNGPRTDSSSGSGNTALRDYYAAHGKGW